MEQLDPDAEDRRARDQGRPIRPAVRKSSRDEQPDPGVEDESDQRHDETGPGRPRPGCACTRGDGTEAEKQAQEHERRDELRFRRRAAFVVPDQPVRADQHSQHASRHPDQDRDADQERVPTVRAVGRARDRVGDQSLHAQRLGRLLGRFGVGIRGDAEAGDEDERQGQEPDEEPVGERARDDSAADLAVTVDHLEDRVDRAMPTPFTLGPFG